MGKIAEMILAGICCELCNVVFVEEHGYPVVCVSCMQDMTEEERKNHQQAIYKEVG